MNIIDQLKSISTNYEVTDSMKADLIRASDAATARNNGTWVDRVGSSVSSVVGGVGQMINVYGAPVDIASAIGVLGSNNYIYHDTSGFTTDQINAIKAGSIVVGGTASGGGISQDLSQKGVVRFSGFDAADTASKLMQWAFGNPTVAASSPNLPSYSPIMATTPGVVSLPSSTGTGTTTVISPSGNPAAAIGAAQGTQTGLNGSTTSVLSGLTFDNLIGVFVGLAFVSAVMGVFKR